MATHKSFLYHIAKTFLSLGSHNLKDYCFIFPNRRSGIFFEKELIDLSSDSYILPKITTISDFLSEITETVECGRIELLFDLYDEYKKLTGEHGESFDQFVHWGDIILNDFNDVDLYLVDAKLLFSNLKEIREIGTDYLSDEQKEVLKEYFGESKVLKSNNFEQFWKHTTPQNREQDKTKEYFHLWTLLGKLYDNFNACLDHKKLAYTGKIYRKAATEISNQDSFLYKQYVFVGFNVLSSSELKIFKVLQDRGIADFYWDLNSPALNDTENKASTFVNFNKKLFKSKYDIGEIAIPDFPHIEIKALPSNVGQVKYASRIIDQLKLDGKTTDTNNLLDTAIVLPDENLFIPLSGSLDKETIGDINITMGFPLKNSSIASLFTAIAKTHRQSRKIKGEYYYYIEDIKSLTAHPYMKTISQEEINELIGEVQKKRMFFVSAKEIQAVCPTFQEIFNPISNISIANLISYIDGILKFIEGKLLNSLDSDENKSLEVACIEKYIELFHQLTDIISNYQLELTEDTFFYLIDRFISSSSISLQGEPLKGLQIMGVLETRCLDFRNIIILSMNEKVFPRKHFAKSFIPYNIRQGFNMSTIEHQESMYAYYFYRMISRAENVFLLYDARTSGLGSGDPSRYIQQLCKIYKDCDAKIDFISFDIKSSQDTFIQVPKTTRILEKLKAYKTDGSGKFLSASTINKFSTCPLRFYFEKIEELNIQDELSEFMSNSTFGTIIHAILNDIYSPYKGKIMPKEHLDKYINNKESILSRLVNKAVNKHFYQKGDECYDELDGEGYMIEDVIIYYVLEVLKYDRNQIFTYYQGEEEEKLYWEDLGINFKQYVDRVDFIENNGTPFLRIIDYKTGNDETSTTSFESAFDNSREKVKKAIIQVFLYCNFYNYYHRQNNNIQPLIYTLKDMSQSQIKINKQIVYDYHDFNDEFMDILKQKITEMFDPNIPFTQTRNDNNCLYCPYKDFCRK